MKILIVCISVGICLIMIDGHDHSDGHADIDDFDNNDDDAPFDR